MLEIRCTFAQVRLIAALFAATVGLLVAMPAIATAQEAAASGGRFWVEGLVLWRSDYDGGLFTDSSPGSVGVVTDPGDFDPDSNGGIRFVGEIPAAALGGLLPPGYALQFTAMYAKGFDGDIAFEDPNENTSTTYTDDLGGIVSPGLDDANSDQIGAFKADIHTTLAGYEFEHIDACGQRTGRPGLFWNPLHTLLRGATGDVVR